MTRPQVRRKNVKTRCRNSGRSCFVNDSVSARISSEFLCRHFNAFFFFFFVELMSEVNNEIKDKSFLLTKLAEKIWKLCCPPFFEKFIPD